MYAAATLGNDNDEDAFNVVGNVSNSHHVNNVRDHILNVLGDLHLWCATSE